MNIIFLDTETTDLGPGARLVQLAYKNSKTGEVVNEYFKPPVPIAYAAMATHHITEEMVVNKPAFEESEHRANLVKEFGKGGKGILVAHNAPFDIGILNNEGIEVAESLCTLRLARQLITDAEQHKLQYLRYLLNLKVEGAAHDALGDILVLEALYKHLEKLVIEKFGLTSEQEMLNKMKELNDAPVLLNNFTFGKYRGQSFAEVAKNDKGYLEWLLNSEMQKNPEEQKSELIYTLKHFLQLPK